MSSIFIYVLLSITISPQNPFGDRYTLTPPLGTIKSLCTSTLSLYAINDNYVLICDKYDLSLQRTIHFDTDIYLIGYDQYFDDLWITGSSTLFRFSALSYMVREFPIHGEVTRLGIDQDFVYLDGIRKFSFNKRSGELIQIGGFPSNLTWFSRTQTADLKNYPFLSPYYYYDENDMSDAPFTQFPITALYDDGMYLYVGTESFGILKYNKVSWQKERLIFGPLNTKIMRVRTFGERIFFITSDGLSYFSPRDHNWRYQRYSNQLADIVPSGSSVIIGMGTQLAEQSGNIVMRVSTVTSDILSLASDASYLYLGTRAGLFRLYHGTQEPFPFGPDRFAVYAIHPTESAVYAGSETGFYQYDRTDKIWSKALPFGVKDIAPLRDELFLLSTNNQLIRYNPTIPGDTNWVLLPYFNVYDIDSDSEVVFCASYAGVYYYEPKAEQYRVIYNLPRILYEHIFVVSDSLFAVSTDNIYTLPLRFRD